MTQTFFCAVSRLTVPRPRGEDSFFEHARYFRSMSSWCFCFADLCCAVIRDGRWLVAVVIR